MRTVTAQLTAEQLARLQEILEVAHEGACDAGEEADAALIESITISFNFEAQ